MQIKSIPAYCILGKPNIWNNTRIQSAIETEDLKAVLNELNSSNDQILLSMIVSNDGFTLAHEGKTIDPDKVGAS